LHRSAGSVPKSVETYLSYREGYGFNGDLSFISSGGDM